MAALSTKPSGGKNGGPVLVYSEELYARFKAALLGTGSPFISNENDTRNFADNQKRSHERNPREKAGHWLKTKAQVEFSPLVKEDWGRREQAYETILKFVPPISHVAMTDCLQRFVHEFGLKNESVDVNSAQEIARLRQIDESNYRQPGKYDEKWSRAAIQSMPGGCDEEIKIQIPASEFKKIHGFIAAPAVSAIARDGR